MNRVARRAWLRRFLAALGKGPVVCRVVCEGDRLALTTDPAVSGLRWDLGEYGVTLYTPWGASLGSVAWSPALAEGDYRTWELRLLVLD